jgi:beta-galactosidase GanA
LNLASILAAFVAGAAGILGCLDAAAVPHLERQGTATRLIVKNRPMLILGGELGNSSASSAAYMAPHWPRLHQMHLNTVLAPVSWELIEPTEGRFEWQSVDSMLAAARANQLKLVLLWFGAWKNSMSSYVPAWVKRDEARFPRARLPNGRGVEILSAFSTSTRDADSRAFCALLAHLKKVDGETETVVMIQVENEIGMLPVARDYGPEASAAFHAPVPEDFIRAVGQSEHFSGTQARESWAAHGKKTAGDWPAVFGESDATAEVFTAFYYGRYVESLVGAGKTVYPIPMYANVALNRPLKAPGEYPSGGPLPHLLDTWKFAAPSLDLLAPDIYFPNFLDLASHYRRPDNPLFIPEANNYDRPEVAANAFFALGALDAIGFGPFSIESGDEKLPNTLTAAYAVLEQLSPAILSAQGLGTMAGFRPRVLFDETVIDTPVKQVLGHYQFTVSFVDTQSPREKQSTASHGGMIIQSGPEEYLVAGQGIIVTFAPVGDGPETAGIDSAWEGTFDAQGRWIPGRLLNGDQTHQGRHVRLAPGEFQIQRVRLYRYQ